MFPGKKGIRDLNGIYTYEKVNLIFEYLSNKHCNIQ